MANISRAAKAEKIRNLLLGDLKEREHHFTFMQWVRLQPLLCDILIHIENERLCTKQQGWWRKQMGVKKGVSDFLLPLPTHKHAGLWIELKRMKDYTIKPEQENWVTMMRLHGYQAVFAFGYQQAIQTVKNYIDEYNEGRLKHDKTYRPLKLRD